MKRDIAVIMSTFNGSEFIVEQLTSIMNQSLKVNKVVICDDFSKDNTCELIEEFINENRLSDKWILIRNEENVGWRKNFHNLIKSISSDFIFLCDQDDIWFNEKVARMVDCLVENPKIEVLTSNFRQFSQSDEISLDNNSETRNSNIYSWDLSFFNSVERPGCTYLIRGDFIRKLNSSLFFDGQNAHDAVIWSVSCARGTLYNFDTALIFWRRHQSSATLNNNKMKVGGDLIIDHTRTINRIGISRELANPLNVLHLDKLLNFYKNRLDIVESGSFFKFILLSIYNISLFKGRKDWLNDFLYIISKVIKK